MPKYGIIRADGTPKPAAAQLLRWNDRTNRHTLYTACGSQNDGYGIYRRPTNPTEAAAALTLYNKILLASNPNATPATQLPETGTRMAAIGRSPDTVIGELANTTKYNWVPVSYPASTPVGPDKLNQRWRPDKISLADSIQAGIDDLATKIHTTPGTFALVGAGQGAAINSKILQRMQIGGDLYHRQIDCIAAVQFGNPMRRRNTTYPGGTNPAGAGILSPVDRDDPTLSGLATTQIPTWWWEMVTPNDFYSDVPLEHLSLIAKVARTLGGYRKVNDLLSLSGNMINAFRNNEVALELIALVLTSIIQKLFNPAAETDLEEILDWLYDHLGDDQTNTPPTYDPDPHLLYSVLKPPTLPTGLAGVTNQSTYTDIALAYINARGNAVTPR